MNNLFVMREKTLALVIALVGLFVGFAILQTQAAENDSSIALKKDPATQLFTLTIKDTDGIQEFSLTPAGKFPYGGELSGCPKTFVITNTNFDASSDFNPVMPAYVIDCQNNTAKLEIFAPKDGFAKSASIKKEETPPPPPAPKEEPTEEKKGGLLSASDMVYPVKELGNCQNEAECRSYCDNSARAKECFAFAKKYNLISEKEAEEAEKHFFDVKKGPGGCNSGVSCEAYCNTVEHLDACIAFAEESGYYSGDKLAEAKKFQTLVKSNAQFPGGCKDRNSCELYCNDARHMEECLNFAETAGFMPEEEIKQARKILPLMQRGETPGGCTSKEQCEKYCFEDSHADECIAFGEKVGLISAEDATMIKKTGGKGPGGCRSKEQCESYCENNSEECFRWAQDNGLVSEGDFAKMKEGMAQFKEQLDKMPPEVAQCLKDAAGEKNFKKLVQGEPIFDRGLEGKMKSCFSQLTSQVSRQLNTLPPEAVQCIKDTVGEEGLRKLQSGEFAEDVDFGSLEKCFREIQSSFDGGPGGPGGSGGFAGPGGCKGIEECTEYCKAHLDECKQFAPPGGGGFPGGGQGGFPGGPGGCKSQEECTDYCKEHQEECKNFMPPGDGGFPGGGATGGQFPGGGATGGGFPGGPGGCTSQEECQTYCQSHPQECQGFIPPGGDGCEAFMPGCPGFVPPVGGGGGGSGGTGGGPGGCQSQEECQAYCQAHPAECGGGGGALPSPPTSSCISPPSGLVSWWSADIVSGTTVSDISDGNNGTLSGGVTLVPMEVGSAFQFDGSSGRISMGNPANLNFGNSPFSLEAWFNWNGGGGTSANNIIRKSNYGPGQGSGYWLRVGSGTLEFSVGATTGPDGQSIITTPISTGVWHHAVAVKDSSGNIKLYVDGQSKGTVLRQDSNTNSTSEVPFLIGAWSLGGGVSEFFNGQIDEVAVYNRALNESEVQNLFGSGSIGKCSAAFGHPNRELPEDYQQQYDQQYQPSQPPSGFVGPGGCKTPEECTTYCTQNYQDPACQQFGPGSQAEPLNQGFFAKILDAFGPIFGIR